MRKEERQRQLFVRLVTAFLILVASIMIIVTIVTVQKNKTTEEEVFQYQASKSGELHKGE